MNYCRIELMHEFFTFKAMKGQPDIRKKNTVTVNKVVLNFFTLSKINLIGKENNVLSYSIFEE